MKAINVAGWLIIASIFVIVLVEAKSLLVPFVIAIVIWYLINALKNLYLRISISGRRMPEWFCLTASTLTILGGFLLVMELIVSTINAMTKAAPEYKMNLDKMTGPLLQSLGFESVPDFSTIANEIDLTNTVAIALNSVSGIASSAVLIMVYVGFLLAEQHLLQRKLAAIFSEPSRLDYVNNILEHINQSVRTYISVKTTTSFLTGILSFIVLLIVGVDFAIFWAFLIFLLNYIPTVGSLVATIFPAMLAFVQFGTFGPGIAVLLGVTAVQFVIGNIIEPKMMGSSLNISPLVVILSLVLWGMIWGVAGMVLCVPIMVIAIIVLAEFPATRFIAILLSGNGKIIGNAPMPTNSPSAPDQIAIEE
ncbi:MAG: AI-2E family transporter [Bacteroidota bacterium]